MSEPIRKERQAGLNDLTARLRKFGIHILDQNANFRAGRTYFEIGTDERRTDFTISGEFLDDLTSTKDYQSAVESYALAVGGRLKCGSPEVFYCQSGMAIRVSLKWPIESNMYESRLMTYILMNIFNQENGQIAKCSMEIGGTLGRTVFDTVLQTVNSVRNAIDGGLVTFHKIDVWQEKYQRVERLIEEPEHSPQPLVERFLAGKAYVLGFLAVEEPSEVWIADPWDAQYLGVSKKELILASRVLQSKGLLTQGSGPEYVEATHKLLAEQSAEKDGGDTFFQPQEAISRLKLPNKEDLLKDMATVLQRHLISAVVVIDLDNFKSVNDMLKSHSEGDACLDRVVAIITKVIGRKGKLYRWGAGDEFALCLPDFSTEEAQVTAERIRRSVEESKPGGEILVTTSIGVCSTDRTNSKSGEEIVGFADEAVYESKRLGKNRVTVWPF
jgi:diguanylate cyclase (GGDEF)-like protein